MPTFLTTRKMSPELRARVEASVRGQRPGAARGKPARVAVFRLALAVTVIGSVAWFVSFQKQAREELEAARVGLLARVQAAAVGLTSAQEKLPEELGPRLAVGAGKYEGDELSGPMDDAESALDALEEPMIYVRGPIADFASPSKLPAIAANSFRDSFVLCLVSPPRERKEKLLAERARAALEPGGWKAHAPRVERLRDVLLGTTYLADSWQDRVRRAETLFEVERLRASFEAAPIAAAQRAASAPFVLSVLDEPKDGTGPTELDGACAHNVRVELRKVKTGEVVLRLRRHVDPSWISDARRSQLASGIDGCALAMDVRETLKGGVAKR